MMHLYRTLYLIVSRVAVAMLWCLTFVNNRFEQTAGGWSFCAHSQICVHVLTILGIVSFFFFFLQYTKPGVETTIFVRVLTPLFF